MKGVYEKPPDLRTICWQDEKFFRVDEVGGPFAPTDADAFVDMCMDHIGPSMVLIIDNAPSHRNKTDLNCLDWLVWELLKKEVGGCIEDPIGGCMGEAQDPQFEKRLGACIKAAGEEGM